MIEKRFIYEEEHFPVALMQIRDIQNNKTYDLEDVCELLNELNNENNQLREINKEYKQKAEILNKIWRLYLKTQGDNR